MLSALVLLHVAMEMIAIQCLLRVTWYGIEFLVEESFEGLYCMYDDLCHF